VTEIEIAVPASADINEVEQQVESAAAAAGLEQRLKSSLAKFPGAIHWHFSRRGLRGTLEMTVWPKHRRCWISVRESRSSEWIPAAVQEIQSAFSGTLHPSRSTERIDH
jgi:hypothetical protein